MKGTHMSEYRPKTLYTIKTERGWMILDQYGEFDGPYETEADARAAIESELKP
jgi:hypothetical protein